MTFFVFVNNLLVVVKRSRGAWLGSAGLSNYCPSRCFLGFSLLKLLKQHISWAVCLQWINKSSISKPSNNRWEWCKGSAKDQFGIILANKLRSQGWIRRLIIDKGVVMFHRSSRWGKKKWWRKTTFLKKSNCLLHNLLREKQSPIGQNWPACDF